MSTARHICLFIGTLGPGGAERVMAWLAHRLADQGVQVTLVTLGGLEGDFIRLDPRIARRALGLDGAHSPLCKPWANVRRLVALVQVLRETSADTVLAFMPHESVLAILAGRLSGRRVVISERNAPWRRSAGQPWNFLRRHLYRFSHVQVAQTVEVACWFKEQAACRSARVVPNAVQYPLPSGLPSAVPPHDSTGVRKLLVAAGTKVHQKGFDILIDAFARIAQDFPDWDLALPGLDADRTEGGLSSAEIVAAVHAAGLQARVHLPGRVGNMSDWYAAADIFVLSSRFEGFPNVLIEAMAHGCPVVAADCETGPRDIVVDDHDGLLVQAENPAALADGMRRLMAAPNLRARLGEQARKVHERYSAERISTLWFELLGVKSGSRGNRT